MVVKNLEEPLYKVILIENWYEIRSYAPYVVAETEVIWDQAIALNDGFRRLAGYIFGGNTTQQTINMTTPVVDTKQSKKIKMTAPVTETKRKNDFYMVQFAMPNKYTLDTLPIPDDSRVILREVKPGKVAVMRYTGFVNEKKVEQKKAELGTMLARDGYEPISAFSSAQYNPPFSFPFMKRNEILVEID